MPPSDWGWLITPAELESWILSQNDDFLVINKPPHTVCHPSRHGPWSSLIGACREYLGLGTLHMPFRLDRETSGVLVFALHREAGTRLQHAVQAQKVRKEYLAIAEGHLPGPVTVDAPIGRDEAAAFFSRQCVRPDGQSAVTSFEPISHSASHTLVKARPQTGRRHQIRVHLSHLGHPIVGDKLYGPDPLLMMEFMEHGFTEHLASRLPMKRCALHCEEVEFQTERGSELFSAPVAEDMRKFWLRHS
ncbi:MAG: RNA pseudouridine synthase [Bryobacteraceae bacterium]|nr:RNA pseudouridine synthase [Bryobacteraceae bacterium]